MIILVAAKTAGYLSFLAHQPAVLGELLVGLLLGPSLLNMPHWPVFGSEAAKETIALLSEIGVLLLMFVAGLELHLSELLRSSKVSALAGVLGVVLPVGAGICVGLGFGYELNQAIFLGLTLGATSVSISAQTLMELKTLRSRVGLGLLGAAVFDDILVILFLSAFLAFGTGNGGVWQVLWIFLRMVIFLAASVAFGLWVLPWLVRRVSRLPISQGLLSLGLVILFGYGLAAELVGSIAAITGAFLAGLMFARSPEKERLERGMSALAYGLFVPIFCEYWPDGEYPATRPGGDMASIGDRDGRSFGKVHRRGRGSAPGRFQLAGGNPIRCRNDLTRGGWIDPCNGRNQQWLYGRGAIL